MSRKVHIVPCGDSFPWGKIITAVLLVCGALWLWHHVLVPMGDALMVALVWAGRILVWGALGVGALCILCTVAFIIVCVVERRRHVHSNSGPWVASLSSGRLARQDFGAPLSLPYAAPHPSVSAGPVDTSELDAAIQYIQSWQDSDTLPVRKPDSLIRCEDDVFMLTHGITPPDYEDL